MRKMHLRILHGRHRHQFACSHFSTAHQRHCFVGNFEQNGRRRRKRSNWCLASTILSFSVESAVESTVVSTPKSDLPLLSIGSKLVSASEMFATVRSRPLAVNDFAKFLCSGPKLAIMITATTSSGIGTSASLHFIQAVGSFQCNQSPADSHSGRRIDRRSN